MAGAEHRPGRRSDESQPDRSVHYGVGEARGRHHIDFNVLPALPLLRVTAAGGRRRFVRGVPPSPRRRTLPRKHPLFVMRYGVHTSVGGWRHSWQGLENPIEVLQRQLGTAGEDAAEVARTDSGSFAEPVARPVAHLDEAQPFHEGMLKRKRLRNQRNREIGSLHGGHSLALVRVGTSCGFVGAV
jgi:hypothetical protein